MNIVKSTLELYKKLQIESTFLQIFQITFLIWLISIPLKNSIYQISTILLIVLFLTHCFYYRQKAVLIEVLFTYKKLLVVFLLFVTSMIISSLFGISEKSVYVEIVKYFFRYLFIFVILLYFYKQSFFSKKSLLIILFAILLLHSLDGIYQYVFGFDLISYQIPDDPSYMLTGAVYHHNPFGLLMAIGGIISLTLFLDPNNYIKFKYDKVIYLISLLVFLFTLFHSQSRAAWVMFGIYFIGYMIIYIIRNGINIKLLLTLIFLSIIVSLLFLFDDTLWHRLTLLLEGHSSGRSTKIWPFTIDKIMDSPLLGYGINTYKLLTSNHKAGFFAGVHNLSLELLLYTGIVGFSIFTYLIWLTLKESFTKDKIVYFFLFVSFIILMQFDGSLIDSKVHLNIFILILFFIYSFRLDKNTPSLVK